MMIKPSNSEYAIRMTRLCELIDVKVFEIEEPLTVVQSLNSRKA
jgi:hypothetical protein